MKDHLHACARIGGRRDVRFYQLENKLDIAIPLDGGNIPLAR